MASQGALGDLVLALSADTATFQADLGKAARVAEKELQKVVITGAAVGTAIGEGIAKAAKALVNFATDTVRVQASMDDLADTVGGNITQLDGLRRVVVVSGRDFNQVSENLTQFSRLLRASSDESNSAVRAVRALGLDLEKLRQMDPASAMRAVAVAMGQFADGGEKAAAAQALFGRSGAQLLPLLKDLAEAGDVNGRVTREQAEQSERLEKETRRLKLAFADTRDDLANKVIPILGDYLEQLREGVRITGSFFGALKLLGTINPVRSLGGNIQELTRDLEALDQVIASERGKGKGTSGFEAQQEDIKKQIEFLKFMQRQDALKLSGSGSMDARDLQASSQKERLDFVATDEAEERKRRKAAEEAERERLRLLKMAAKSEEDYLLAQHAEIEFNDTLIRQAVDRDRAERKRIELLAERSSTEALLAEHAALEARDDIIRADALRRRKEGTKELNDITKSLGFTFQSAFEDAIIEGNKLSDVLKSLEKDIARIILRMTVTQPLAEGLAGLVGQGFGAFFSGAGGGGSANAITPSAEGGHRSAGQMLLVGERGPELFVPGMSGTVVPNDSLGGVTINQSINVDSRSDQASIVTAMRAAKDQAIAEIQSMQQRRGESRI